MSTWGWANLLVFPSLIQHTKYGIDTSLEVTIGTSGIGRGVHFPISLAIDFPGV
jgi:hypothetical protein